MNPIEYQQLSEQQLDVMADQGYRAFNRNQNTRRVCEAARLYADALTGRIDPFLWKQAFMPTHEVYVEHLSRNYPGIFPQRGALGQIGLRETMSFSDYQALFVDVLDRQYYGYYNTFPIVLLPAVKKATLQDFRLVKRFIYDSMVSPYTQVDPAAPAPQQSLTGPVPQGGSTLATASTGGLTYQPAAYKSGASVNWRAYINDDLGIFQDVPQRLATEGNRGISKILTSFFFDADGPIAALFSNTYGNIINTANGASSNNPELSAQGLSDAFKIAAGMKDSSGNPINLAGQWHLLYGPYYEATVQNLLNQTAVNVSVEGGNQNTQGFPTQFVQVRPWMMGRINPIMDAYIPIVSSNHPKAWMLVLDPGAVNRPAVEFGRLKGFDTPQIFQRVPSVQRLGGGVDPMMGSFDTLNTDMQIIGVHGGTQIDGRSAIGSNGSGT